MTLLARVAPTMRRAVVDLSTISRDEAVVADYRADPLVHHGHPTIALSLAMLDQMTLLAARARDLRLPLLVQHGTADRICHPDGSRALETGGGHGRPHRALVRRALARDLPRARARAAAR